MAVNCDSNEEMESSGKFSLDEKVFCFQGSLLYDGKIVKMEYRDDNLMFLIHYVGWRKSYDEWVPAPKVLKVTPKTIKQKERLERSMQAGKTGKLTQDDHKHLEKKLPSSAKLPVKPKPVATTSATSPIVSGNCQAENSLQEITDTSMDALPGPSQMKTRAGEKNLIKDDKQGFRVNITMPENLKIILVDDYDLINNKKKLVHLPARISVDDLIELYHTERFSEDGMTLNKQTCIKEMSKGIQLYFNTALSKQLLYLAERPQYEDIISENPKKCPTQLYGAIHLMRLFAKMNTFLAKTVLDEEGASLITQNMDEFQQFLSESLDNSFNIDDYEDA